MCDWTSTNENKEFSIVSIMYLLLRLEKLLLIAVTETCSDCFLSHNTIEFVIHSPVISFYWQSHSKFNLLIWINADVILFGLRGLLPAGPKWGLPLFLYVVFFQSIEYLRVLGVAD